jgi:hypothetical protein
MGEMIQEGELHPTTANDRLAMLGRILTAAAVEFEWDRNPMAGIDRFDTSEHPTYTEEEPNSLTGFVPRASARFGGAARSRT